MTIPELRQHLAEDRQALAETLAHDVASTLSAAVATRGVASLVVSGGSTPRPFFAALASKDLPWDKVWVTLADERWVPADRESSNEALVREHLLVGPAARARFVGLWKDSPTPEDGQTLCEQALTTVPRPFDVLVLGMGGDGHTASLFPDAAELAAGLDLSNGALCLPVRPPEAPHPRMSLTLAALVASRQVILHITGADKRQVLDRALGDGPEDELPIRGVLRHFDRGVDLYWAP